MTIDRQQARVDVLLPVRWPAPWLGLALESVVNQTTDQWRLLVVMDGYSKEVEDICGVLPVGTPLETIVLPAGSGLVAALNAGLFASKAEYVARLDADDVCHPERIARQLAYIESQPKCVVVGCGYHFINEDGSPLGLWNAPRSGSVMRQLRWRTPIAHPSALMKRSSAIDVKGYSPSAKHAEDFDLWLRLAAIGEIHVLADPLLSYRVHAGQVTSRVKFSRETLQEIERSRIALAQSRGESTLAARVRQVLWIAANRTKAR